MRLRVRVSFMAAQLHRGADTDAARLEGRVRAAMDHDAAAGARRARELDKVAWLGVGLGLGFRVRVRVRVRVGP